MDFYRLSLSQVFRKLDSTSLGLSQKEAERRLKGSGLNILERRKEKTLWKILWEQLSQFLIVLLIISAIILFLMPETTSHLNALVLVVIIFLNVLMGFIQEYKAEKALEALRKITPLRARVRREDFEQKISVRILVPGDIVILEQGDRVPADLRIIKSTNLKIDESALTGESVASPKHSQEIKKEVPLADQENIAFSGTYVVFGHGEGVVTETGKQTEFGKIARLVQEREEKTPLQKRLIHLGKLLALISGILVAIIFLLGLWQNYPIGPLFSYVVALLVSAVPESLPTVTTLALALGIINLARQKAVIRKLPVIESLGSVNIICADKTGTLTKNEMTVTNIWLFNKNIQVTGSGYLPSGEFFENGKKINPQKNKDLFGLLKIASLCNTAQLQFNPAKNKWEVFGDPTEGALKVLAEKGGIDQPKREKFKKILECPFDSHLKRMSVIVQEDKTKWVFIKGAPAKILEISDQILIEEKEEKLKKDLKEKVLKEAENLANEGFRVLALGYRRLPKLETKREKIEKEIVFVGLVGMIDPPDEGVKEALKLCKKAQIEAVIITGDHRLTAKKVAEQLGLKVLDEQILEGQDLEKMKDSDLDKIVDKIVIYARTSPIQKIKIVNSLKRKGYIVALTGDGINDAPALRAADVGIAMGIRGTDVARESSDMVLTDDKFGTIVQAIKYGRTIYDNIKKFFTFLLSGNFDELVLVSFAFVVGLPQPFTTLQILWINFITDSFPALALAFEKPTKETMEMKPRDPSRGIIKPIIKYALFLGLLGVAFELFLFLTHLPFGEVKARTLIFTFCVFFELFVVFSIRSEKPFWQENVFANKKLIYACLISAFLQIIVIYGPLGKLFQTVGLDLKDWLLIIGGGLSAFLIAEIIKVMPPSVQKLIKG